MNDVPRPGNDGARSAQRVPAGSRGPEQAYPDPPRSWTRAGILIGTWVAAWAGVLVFGLGLQAMAQGQDNDRLPLNGQAASRQLFHEMFLEKDLETAAKYLCDTYSGLPLETVQKKYMDWEAQNGRTGVTVSVNQVTPQEYEISIDYGPDNAVVIERFTTITQPREPDDCIDDLFEREQADTDVPSPDESPDAPEVSGREAIEGYFNRIFEDQDLEQAEVFQCDGYTGASASDLLEIFTSHEHEGAGSTLYSLSTNATGTTSSTDEHSVVISLDDDKHTFKVIVDASTPKRCISSVVPL